jgi:hypothetical protein
MSQLITPEGTLPGSRIVEQYAHFYDRPDARLRFLNKTLARHTEARVRLDSSLSGRFAFLKETRAYEHLLTFWLHHLIFKELMGQSRSATKRASLLSLKSRAPLTARVCFLCYRFRPAFYAVAALTLLSCVYGAYAGASWTARRVGQALAARDPKVIVVSEAGEANAAAAVGLTEYNPEKVWSVEQTDAYERYSNGARILREYETEGRARGFYAFRTDLPKEDGGEVMRRPVGIVYHTSESDLLPFNSGNTESIEATTRGLLAYVRKNSSYNYVIDRFGQIYRVVRDEGAANHAGNSVWAGRDGLYVGLNDSFLGVCFETQTAAGDDERLTEAQVVAGRLLTQVLRSRHQIDDANCVTHGLVSVNPTSMLICFHHDWARGFPFGAMGLSDKYAVPPASVAHFGFTYDEEVLGRLGGRLWPGVLAAEGEFNRRAEESSRQPDEMRQEMREQYRRQMEVQRDLRRADLARGVDTNPDGL